MRAVWASWRQGGTVAQLSGRVLYAAPDDALFCRAAAGVSGSAGLHLSGERADAALAGSLCEGVHIHPFHSAKYLREFAWPHLREGMHSAGRSRLDFTAVGAVFAIPTDGRKPAHVYAAAAREQIAFYMSTPAYRSIVDLHGWSAAAEQLSQMARRGEWQAMGQVITDEMLDAFAVTGKWADLPWDRSGALRRAAVGSSGLLSAVCAWRRGGRVAGDNCAVWGTIVTE